MLLLRRHLLPLFRTATLLPSPIRHRGCLLSSSAAPFCLENYLVPRLLDLRDRLGLSTPQIAGFFLVGSRALRQCDVVPRLEFFISLLGSFEDLLWTMKKSDRIIRSDFETVVKPSIALYRQSGLSVRDIAQMCLRWPWLLSYKPERVKEFVPRAEELGVPRSSRMFSQALAAVAHNSKEKVAARLEFLKSTLGCSESDVATAVSKMPTIIGISEDCLRHKIEFLANEARLEPQFIVQRPYLLTLSLEKRMIPRHCVMKVLLAKGLLSNMNFYTVLRYGEKTFKLKFI